MRVADAHHGNAVRRSHWAGWKKTPPKPGCGILLRRPSGPCGQPEGGGSHLPARHVAQPRSPAAHPCRAGQHGPGRRRQMADHGQRGPVPQPEADRHDLPERTGEGPDEARIRYREDACRWKIRDRGGVPPGDRGVLDPRRAEIEAAVAERSADGSGTAANQRLAERAALMTRASKRDVDKEALREHWKEQASTLGLVFSASNEASRESGEAAGKSRADSIHTGNRIE